MPKLINKESNSFKLGLIAGVCLWIAIQNFVLAATVPELRLIRIVFFVLFGVAGVLSTLFAYKKL